MYCNPQFCCNFVYWVACKPAGPFSRRIIMSRTANPRRLCCISPVLKALSAHPPTSSSCFIAGARVVCVLLANVSKRVKSWSLEAALCFPTYVTCGQLVLLTPLNASFQSQKGAGEESEAVKSNPRCGRTAAVRHLLASCTANFNWGCQFLLSVQM